MGCGSCGSGGSCGTGKPGGCNSNGGCSTGGCNRLNVYNWLQNIPLAYQDAACTVVEVSFNQGSRKEFFRNQTGQYFEKGTLVTVEGVGGFDVGEVSLSGELVRLQLKKAGVKENNPEIKKILRKAGEKDIELYKLNKGKQKEALARSRAAARQLNLNMKLSEVDIQADGKKATFFYTADDRVDFRELIKIFASEFKLKVEMRQIGIRQDAAKVGGIGSCGRELCCSSWLHDFKSVNTTTARYQNLSINQTKLSGQCGRLKCCLNFELDTYLEAFHAFPENADVLQLANGTAHLLKKDLLRNLLWYSLHDGTGKQHPVTIERVKAIQRMNRNGEKPAELGALETAGVKVKEIEPQFVDVVGQISLRSLERNQQKRRREEQDRRRGDQRNNRDFNNRPDNNRPNNRSDARPDNRPPRQAPPRDANAPRPDAGAPKAAGTPFQNRPPKGNRPPQNGPRPPANRPQITKQPKPPGTPDGTAQ